MFTHFFNADFKRINELGNIEEFVSERSSRDPRGRRERQRGDRRDRNRDRNDRGQVAEKDAEDMAEVTQ